MKLLCDGHPGQYSSREYQIECVQQRADSHMPYIRRGDTSGIEPHDTINRGMGALRVEAISASTGSAP